MEDNNDHHHYMRSPVVEDHHHHHNRRSPVMEDPGLPCNDDDLSSHRQLVTMSSTRPDMIEHHSRSHFPSSFWSLYPSATAQTSQVSLRQLQQPVKAESIIIIIITVLLPSAAAAFLQPMKCKCCLCVPKSSKEFLRVPKMYLRKCQREES